MNSSLWAGAEGPSKGTLNGPAINIILEERLALPAGGISIPYLKSAHLRVRFTQGLGRELW
ncbi:MAG: hypothetical protein ACC633_03120 [Anaerolineales bacterium]